MISIWCNFGHKSPTKRDLAPNDCPGGNSAQPRGSIIKIMQQRHQRLQMFHLISQGWLKRKRTGSIVLFRWNIRVPIGVPFIQWWSNAGDILKPLWTSRCVIPSLVYLAQPNITRYKPQPLHSHTCIYIYMCVCIFTKVRELFCFFLRFVFFDLRGGACCLLVPWRQAVYSVVSIHFPRF